MSANYGYPLSDPISNGPQTVFSCLDIPVQGVVPADNNAQHEPHIQPSAAASEAAGRAPRKSKTEAIAAMNRASSSFDGMDMDEVVPPRGGTKEKYSGRPPIPVSPILDLSDIKTASPRLRADGISRPFGLQNCPEYFPTLEEFRDPMMYIRSISEHAREFGMCKIVPPPEWKMPFVTDTKKFHFKTRLQTLNSIEATSRAKVNFLEQLYRFHKQQGNPRVTVPTINNKSLDLWLLRKEVHKRGGYDAVVKGRKWTEIGLALGYRGIPGLSTQIKSSYIRVILPYEHFCDRVSIPILSIPWHGASHQLKTSTSTTASSAGASTSTEALPASTDESISSIRRNTRSRSAAERPGAFVRSMQDDRTRSLRPTRQQACEICQKKNAEKSMLLCDGCDCGFHTFCLNPPLTSIPKDQWFCFLCLASTGGDYGFDEGDEHSLSTFKARDLEFRQMWFEANPPTPGRAYGGVISRVGDVDISEHFVEEEFWRLVESPNETVEIEYGADLHSATHGSAMPSLETHPLDPYSADPWNLNNIPIVHDSLLRYIKSDISGMTVPWTYVGMTFSTFCWHNEDHYTYSINFMHWGETKTWYAIPGDDALLFEAAMRNEAPDLFQAQPDLLFQLVTLMNPRRVLDAGVRVYACNQRAGEIVITFPKSYHAGFNHGLNFNEAVNFALPDWLQYDRECVERYRLHRKPPVFSHDELLITITEKSQTIETALWLLDSLREMRDREIADRQKIRSLGISEEAVVKDLPEEQYQCSVCKIFCYLSQVTCSCSTRVVCADHIDLLCTEPESPGHMKLRLRYTDARLNQIFAKVEERANIPANWKRKLDKLLSIHINPPVKLLRTILVEGEKMKHPLPELAQLRKCLAHADEWIDAANGFLVRKQKRRPRRSRNGNDKGDEDERPDKTLDELHALEAQMERLGVDCPEKTGIQVLSRSAALIRTQALALLDRSSCDDNRATLVTDCRRLLLDASSIHVLLPEVHEVEKIVEREELMKEIGEVDETDAPMTLDEVHDLYNRAITCNLPHDSSSFLLLNERLRKGEEWEARAKLLLSKPTKTIDEMQEIVDADASIPIHPELQDQIRTALVKANDFAKQAIAWLRPSPGDGTKHRLQEVNKLVSRCEKDYDILVVRELGRAAEIASGLEQRCEEVLKRQYQTKVGEDAFESFRAWSKYAREHLYMFVLPSFERLDQQLANHYGWIRDLPWYNPEEDVLRGQPIFEDVMASTSPDDDIPPNDEYFTCICTEPVRPPASGTVSDAVQCDHCFARFHAECAKNGGSCPFCDHHHWNGPLHKDRDFHFCYLPNILLKAPDITKFYSKDWKQLELIVHRIDNLSASIGQFLSFIASNQLPEYIHQARHYMRKLYRIQFVVSPNPEISFGLDLAGLHRILATRPTANPTLAGPSGVHHPKKKRAKLLFGQDSDGDWVDGTRCVCRGLTPKLARSEAIECKSCMRRYHIDCVFYPPPVPSAECNWYTCPLCCMRKARPYPYAEVRVRPPRHINLAPDVYVDTKKMIELNSPEILYYTLPKPFMATLFVELVKWTPGDDSVDRQDSQAPSTSSGRSTPYRMGESSVPSVASS
ncbi:hypothetical protein FISHEDRAFT_35625, partial [Fistulina hepatica ATCC 64428]